MKANKKSVTIKCPFWKALSKNGHMIICEGIDERSSFHIAFGGQKAMREYVSSHCESLEGCKDCMLYDTLDYHKYFEQQNDKKETTDG